ncbi:hypothetical protein [Glycomyces buryatensis]|uniref:Uncharacterized protein n=1 Tax=Glycomyces buryatensis TaxID=2570927 RepID=A0A4S8Q869_9ACTN|nr:hypothetical protein [Glycomyces buryatensis]THV40577.1 hypothetical protein FAB82_15025 [Glycomyces buryatensis]
MKIHIDGSTVIIDHTTFVVPPNTHHTHRGITIKSDASGKVTIVGPDPRFDLTVTVEATR